MRVAIVVPSGDMLHADFAFCLSRMVMSTMMHGGVQIGLVNPKSSLVQKARWQGVNAAVEMKADKILFIDSDQTFPAESLLRLLSHNKKIIGATCCKRTEPHVWTAKINGKNLNKKTKGIVKVETNGFPFCLVDVEVFKKIPVSKWFEVKQDFNGKWTSEDESFCSQASLVGYDVLVDADLSKKIGHIGSKNFI